MKTHKPVAIGHLISGGSDSCATLLRQTQRFIRLTRVVQEHLPEPLNRHCMAANIHDGSLVLITDSPVWSSRLRFHAPGLLRDLERRHAVTLNKVLIRVIPPEQVRPVAVRPKPQMSAATAGLLHQVAASMNDPAMGEALRRLARNSKKTVASSW